MTPRLRHKVKRLELQASRKAKERVPSHFLFLEPPAFQWRPAVADLDLFQLVCCSIIRPARWGAVLQVFKKSPPLHQGDFWLPHAAPKGWSSRKKQKPGKGTPPNKWLRAGFRAMSFFGTSSDDQFNGKPAVDQLLKGRHDPCSVQFAKISIGSPMTCFSSEIEMEN